MIFHFLGFYFSLLAFFTSPPMFPVHLGCLVQTWTCLPLLQTPQCFLLFLIKVRTVIYRVTVDLLSPVQPECSRILPATVAVFQSFILAQATSQPGAFAHAVPATDWATGQWIILPPSCCSQSLELHNVAKTCFQLCLHLTENLGSTEGQTLPLCIYPAPDYCSQTAPRTHWLGLTGRGGEVDRRRLGLGVKQISLLWVGGPLSKQFSEKETFLWLWPKETAD